ncbi:E3 ubiquitin-protein ligase RNF31-like [Engystomops pustulosus]|uniref:E3 ubiquitin-protein ligase RNF31-like n=1 Tax=Engystomops pustulosus TaxID=76066 RepID=UPI003AFAE1E3
MRNTRFQALIQRCWLFLRCKKTDNEETVSTSDVSVKVEDVEQEQLKQIMYEELSNKGLWSEEDIWEAVSVNPDYDSAVKYLSHECQICCEKFSFSKFVHMTHCSCSFCKNCFTQHFSSVIKEKSIFHVKCPICKKPDLENKEESMEFFNYLDIQIKQNLDQGTHELFQCKLRDRALMKMPNFRWCSHCPSGILHEGNTLEMQCPDCNKSTCFQCKEQWDDMHLDLTCEQFKTLRMEEENQNPTTCPTKNEIVCPSCKYRFDLWKGGCLHFTCTQCEHEFCGGCKQPFHQSSECDFSEDCGNKGLHAHHRRDCFYYLRDWDVERLQKLLQHNKIQYDFKTKSDTNNEPKSLLKSLQASNNTLNKGDNTSSSTEEKEYLVEVINTNNLDPLDLFTEEEMIIELQRWKVTIPENCDGEKYLQTLQEKIKADIPLGF